MRKSANTRPRRVLGAILALCMLVGLLPMTAFAAAPAPLYADWDGTKAEWVQPAGDYQRIRYHISLVKTDDGQRGTPVPIKDGEITVTTENTYYDLSDAIAKAGDGKYWFTVQSETGTVIGDPDSPTASVTWNNDLSEPVDSLTTYDSSIGTPSEVSWKDGEQNETAAVWMTVKGAQGYEFELYRNGALVHYNQLGVQSTVGGQPVGYGVSGYVYNYGGEFQFRVRPIKDGFVGGWAESGTKMVVLKPVDTIKIENASLDVTADQEPQFNATVAESDEQYYWIVEGWQGSDGKMITSDEAMNDKLTNKITVFEDGVTYNYFLIVTAYSGYMVTDNAQITLNSEALTYNISEMMSQGKAADGDAMAGFPIENGFHQAQLFDLYSATAEQAHTHAYEEEWKYDNTNHWHECSCGAKADTGEHTFGEWVETTPATATEPGEQKRTCKVCQYAQTETIPVIVCEHEYTYKYDENQHWQQCSKCNETTEREDHTGGEYNCTEPAACTVCGYEYIDPDNHFPGVSNEVPATCTEAGYSGDLVCLFCGTELGKGTTVPATGHNEGLDWKEDGSGHWKTCAKCGETLETGNHTYNGGICSVCGYIEASSAEDKAIMAKTTGISSPVKAQEYGKEAHEFYYEPSDYIYFGMNEGDPIQWRVLDAYQANDSKTPGLFLFSEKALAYIYFNETEEYNDTWEGSDAQKWCLDFAENLENFTLVEQGAMFGVDKTDSAGTLLGLTIAESSLESTDTVFFLSFEELMEYVGNYDYAKGFATDYRHSMVGWWTRSPYSPGGTGLIGAVADNGSTSPYRVSNENVAARPAFNLAPEDILFISAAEGGKPEGGLQAVPGYEGNEWKLTMKDAGRSDFTAACTSYEGGTATINYTDAQVGDNEYISAIIADGSGVYTHYSRLAKAEAAGSVTLDLSSIDMAGKTLYIFNEQYNGDKKTDYASELRAIELKEGGSPHTHAYGEEWKYDNTNHWHECSCGAKADTAAHTFGEWTETKPATATEPGEKKRTCRVCQYAQTETIPVITPEPEPANDGLWVDGVQVTNENAADVLGDGTVTYDAASGTLTLNNAKLTKHRTGDDYIYDGVIDAAGNLNIVLIGENSITTPDGSEYADGIDVGDGNLTITGKGEGAKLTIDALKGNNGIYNDGIRDENHNLIEGGNTTIKDCELIITADYEAIDPSGTLNIENSTLNLNSETAETIDVSKDITITGSNVTMTAPDNEAIDTSGAMTIEASTVKATSLKEALEASNDILIRNSTVTAVSTHEPNGSIYYEAIQAGSGDSLQIENSNVLAQSNYKALRNLPVLKDVTAQGSTSYDGASPETYDETKNDSYKWFKTTSATEPPVEEFTLTADKDSLRGGGTVTLTASKAAALTCSDESVEMVPAEGKENTQWTVKLSNKTAEYTFTATALEGGQTASITVKVTRSGGGGGGGTTRYTVTFNTQGGSEIDSVRVTRNSTVTKPEEPTREGYTFEGWFTDKECTEAYDFDTKVTKNLTLYAKWTEKSTEPTDPDEPDKPVEPTPEPEWENPFEDVKAGDWFYGAVRYASENGLFSGTTETTFAPNQAITRGMLVTVLWRTEKQPVVNYLMTFEDVDQGAYYAEAVRWAASEGIVKGYSETEFAPDKLISREEMAALINRYADYKGISGTAGGLSKFADENLVAGWARGNMEWAVGSGLISGKDGNMLDPQGNTTRAETAVILQRLLEK